jgi:hypothetical protein
MSNISITQGTQTSIRTTTIGTNEFQHVILNQGTSSDSPFTGTIGTVGSVLGIRDKLYINSIDLGTIDAISQLPPNYFTVTTTSGTSTLGTIKAAVAGSAIFVTDLIISAGTITTLVIGMGGTSTPLIGTLSFGQYGGLVTNFRTPGSVTSGSALVYQQSANNTLSITATGFVR